MPVLAFFPSPLAPSGTTGISPAFQGGVDVYQATKVPLGTKEGIVDLEGCLRHADSLCRPWRDFSFPSNSISSVEGWAITFRP